MKKFKELGIDKLLLQAIKELKFETPTEIQEKSIPHVIQGKDVIAESATGSGKTLAFSSGIIQNVVKGHGIQALILTPTRELAEQITKAMQTFSKHKPLRIIEVYGGVAINPQINRLRSADVVVATPGRILDHMERGTVDLSDVTTFVLDEADRMSDMGFIDDVEKIISACPQREQTLLFSATMSEDISRIAKQYMNSPIRISAVKHVDPKKLKQFYYDVPDNQKFSLLVHLIKQEKDGLIMVFCNTRKNTDFVANNLKVLGIHALPIHGGFSQAKRSKVMETFHKGKVSVLVCTDVAARGLDIHGVSHVYNYDAPKESKQYIHRIGRTARAGEAGKAVNLVSSRDHENFARVMWENSLKIPRKNMPKIPRVPIKWRESGGQGSKRNFGGKSRRPYKSDSYRINSRFERRDNRPRERSEPMRKITWEFPN